MKNLHDQCLSIPRLERVNYFFGQMLGVREFQSEQRYFQDKQRLHNRYLHGFGVVCGLAIKPSRVHRDPCAPDVPTPAPQPPPVPGTGDQTPPSLREVPGTSGEAPQPVPPARPAPSPPVRAAGTPCVEIDCGIALSCEGDEILVREPVRIDLWQHLDAEGRDRLASGTSNAVWVAICYRACPTDPVRSVQIDACTGALPSCVPSRLRDDFCVKVTVAGDHDRPHDCACSPRDDRCPEPCLVLARVSNVTATTVVVDGDIDNSVRRPVSLYQTTRISGISWVHAATYSRDDADNLLDEGIEIAFSGEVHGETITRGVIDLWGIEGGDGRSGQLFNISGDFVGGPPTGPVRNVRFRRTSRERVNSGDRVLITFRSAFVLDRCCRAVDGEHVGGRIPLIPAAHYARWARPAHNAICDRPAAHDFQGWRSGNGTPGGTFESWFYIA